MRFLVVALAGLLALAGSCNRSPSIPIVFGPPGARPGDTLFFTAKSVDVDGDEVSYKFDWGDGDSTDWGEWTLPDVDFPGLHAFADSGAYDVRARARDEVRETDWSEPLLVPIREFGPTVPMKPSGPDSVAVGDSFTFTTRSFHPLGEEVAIQFDWGDTLGTWSGYVPPGEDVKARRAYGTGGWFAVQARAKDLTEHVTGWSHPSSLLVVDSIFGPSPKPAAAR